MNREDLLAELPAPRDDEPPSLRGDIADELLDHLQCAYRREVLKDGDAAAAERRVLDRFGDPKKLARRLWRQALWSRVMGTRILSGLQWVLTLAAVVMAGAVFWQQSQLISEMKHSRLESANSQDRLMMGLTDLRNRILAHGGPVPVVPFPGQLAIPDEPTADDIRPPATENQRQAAGGNGEGVTQSPSGLILAEPTIGTISAKLTTPRTLTVRLCEKEGDIVRILTSPIQEITLIGENGNQPGLAQMPPAGGMGPQGVRLQSANGVFIFTGLEPDRYELKITLRDGQHCTKPVVVRDEKPVELTIVCPGPRKKVPVLITGPELPEDLRLAGATLYVQTWDRFIELERVKWLNSGSKMQSIEFDSQSGAATQISGESEAMVNVNSSPPEDRVVFLSIGPANYQLAILVPNGPNSKLPVHLDQKDGQFVHQVEPGAEEWELELPEELLDAARKQMQPASPAVDPFDNAPETKTDNGNAGVPNVPVNSGRLRITVRRGDENANPVAGIRCNVLPADGQRQTDLVITRDDGVALLRSLPAGDLKLYVGEEAGYSLTRTIRLAAGEKQELEIALPPRPPLEAYAFAADLPDDLAAAGVRVEFQLQPEPLEFRDETWQIEARDYLHPVEGGFGVGPRGFAGMLGSSEQMWWLNEAADRAFTVFRTDLQLNEPKTEVRKQLPAVAYRATGLRLIRPVAGAVRRQLFDGEKDPQSWWEIVAPPITRDMSQQGKSYAEIDQKFTPETKRWKLDVPEELLRAAREQIEAGAGEPAVKPDGNFPAGAAALPAGLSGVVLKFAVGTKDGPAAEGMKVHLQRHADDPQPDDSLLELANRTRKVRKQWLGDGIYLSSPLIPGRYRLMVKFPDGRLLECGLPELQEGVEQREHIVCPPPVKLVSVKIAAPPVPVDFLKHRIGISANLTAEPVVIDGREWKLRAETSTDLKIDWKSGLMLAKHDKRSLELDDGETVVPEGAYRLAFSWYTSQVEPLERGERVTPIPLAAWPTAADAETAHRTLRAGDNEWTVQVPEDFWAAAREKLTAGVARLTTD